MPARPLICVHCGVQQYHLSWNEDIGDPAEYGDPAALEARGRKFTALVDEAQEGEEIQRISLLPDGAWVVETSRVEHYFNEYDEVDEDSEEDETEEGESDQDEPDAGLEESEESDSEDEEEVEDDGDIVEITGEVVDDPEEEDD